ECFAQLGFERATNRAIASACGLTAAAVYRHFDSKPDLYVAVMRDADAEVVPQMREAIASERSPRAALQKLMVTFANEEHYRAAGVRFLSAIPSEMQRHPEIAKRVLTQPGETFALMTELVEACVRAGEIPSDKAQNLLALYVAMLIGLSTYSSAVGYAQGELAVAGFADLLSESLFTRAEA
ncbi:MAG TPA: TetR/AcrR family transcriptional regulator, partial [Polyangiales bacterium]|nr:TetR/AcrR family transcriptional regulator [Polyangiales bacterium]